MVKKQKLSIFLVLFLLSFSIATSFFSPKALGASNFESDIDKFFKLQAFKQCLDNANFADTLVKGESKTFFGNTSGVDFNESNTGISVGYSVDADNGQWICGEPSHAEDWLKLIGYKNFADFRDENYKVKNDYLLELKSSADSVKGDLKSRINKAMPTLTDAQLYLNYLRSFEKCASGPKNKNDINGTTIKIDHFVKKDGTKVDPAYFERTEADQISVGHGVGAGDGRFACETIAARINSLSGEYKKWADDPANKEDVAAVSTSSSGPAGNDDSCEAQTGVLAWLGCPLLALISGALNWIDAQINRLMIIDRPLYTNDKMYQSWAKFRNIGLTLLIVAMLVMVISTALSLNFLDAYTVKKAFPRMVASIIFITLSWWICIFMIDLFNTIGQGVLGIMTAPFGLGEANPELTSLFNVSAGGAAVQGATIVVAAAALTLPGALGILLSWVGAALLVLGIAFLTLVARQMVIIVLVLFSPLAILSWIFPNNDKLWKFWWSTFTKLLLMYPIVMALIGAGRIFASVIATTSDGGAQGGLLNPMLKLTAYVLPYAFIPFTFKAAGGVFGNLVGMANDRSKGAFDRLRKGRQKSMSQIGHNAAQGKLVRGGTENNRRGGINRGVERLANISQAGLDPRYMRTRMRNALSDGTDAHLEEAVKNSSFGTWSGDDAKLWAARYDTREDIGAELARQDAGRFGAGKEEARSRAVEQIMRSKRELAPEAFARARIRAQAKTGTGYINQQTGAFDASLMLRDINEAYGDDRNGAGAALAEMRSSLANSGQVAGMAGYGTWGQQMDNLYDHRGADEATRATIAQEAHNAIMDDTINSVAPGQALYGKPSSAAAIGEAHARRIEAIADSLSSGASVIPTGQNDANGNPILRSATEDDLSAAVANAAGIYDAMAQASPNNANAMAESLMGREIEGPEFTVATQQEKWENGERAVEADGRPAFETVTQTLKPKTVREYIDAQMNGNTAFRNRRKDFSAATWAQGQQAQAAAAIAGGPGGSPIKPPSTGMPGT